MTAARPLILASTSRYKKDQLQRLGIPFACADPNIIENHELNLHPKTLAENLALQKASAVARKNGSSICIGSDQTAKTESGLLLTKPGTKSSAVDQLMNCSNQAVTFYSAVTLCFGGKVKTWSVDTQVMFRSLTIEECTRYVDYDNPIDCAGSFKMESLGISLFERVTSDDPTALVGLPLLSLCKELRCLGIQAP